jgi:uncharacterized coiled-coil protein SlyX
MTTADMKRGNLMARIAELEAKLSKREREIQMLRAYQAMAIDREQAMRIHLNSARGSKR